MFVFLAWQGVDTVIVSAGASSLRPVLEIARGDSSDEYPGVEGVQRTANVATAALSANYIGPLTAAVTFVSTCQVCDFRSTDCNTICMLDPSPGEIVGLALNPPHILSCRSYSLANTSTLLFYERSESTPVPVTRYRAPTREVLSYPPLHRRG